MRISICICTWNRCELLRQTLQQLTRLVVPPDLDWELVVVDNNSTDATQDVIASFAGRLPIRSVFEPVAGLSSARNRGLREARGAYVLWTDDDVLVDENWLVEFWKATVRHPNAAVFGGPIDPWFPIAPDPDLLEAFHWLRIGFCGLNYQGTEGPLDGDRPVWGANFALRRTALAGLTFDESVGPSPDRPGGGGDETTLITALRRRGETVVWCPTMRVRHYVDPSRMTRQYLEAMSLTKGREAIATDATPVVGPTYLSVPRWCWREWARVSCLYLLACVAPRGVRLPHNLRSGAVSRASSRRVRRLTWRREQLYLTGMIAEYRQRAS